MGVNRLDGELLLRGLGGQGDSGEEQNDKSREEESAGQGEFLRKGSPAVRFRLWQAGAGLPAKSVTHEHCRGCAAQAERVSCGLYALDNSGRTQYSGPARRKQVGRQQHSEFNPKARTTSPLILLERSMKGRVPALIKLKYQMMAETPFAYFRGAVAVMAADLAVLPSPGIMSQLCGDAHVRNLAPMPRRTDGWSSTSTTSTRRSVGRSSGT